MRGLVTAVGCIRKARIVHAPYSVFVSSLLTGILFAPRERSVESSLAFIVPSTWSVLAALSKRIASVPVERRMYDDAWVSNAFAVCQCAESSNLLVTCRWSAHRVRYVMWGSAAGYQLGASIIRLSRIGRSKDQRLQNCHTVAAPVSRNRLSAPVNLSVLVHLAHKSMIYQF